MHLAKEKISPQTFFRSLTEYDNAELRAVKFRSDREADHALELIGRTPSLKRMPFHFADGLTFIIPYQAVSVLRLFKLHFKASHVLEMDDLDPKERAEIRRHQSL